MSALKSQLKGLVRGLAKKAGIKISKDRDQWFPAEINLLALFFQAFVEADAAARGRDIRLIQVGANDGSSFDSVTHLIHRPGVRAALVEPMPAAFAKLSQRHQGRGTVSLHNVALGEADGQATLYRLHSDTRDVSDLTVIASMSREHLWRMRGLWQGMDARIVEERVPVKSARSLMKDAGFDSVDVLAVDTEGHDAVIVNGFLDAGVKPSLIEFEHVHVPAAADRALRKRLSDAGYVLVRSGFDTFAVLRPLVEKSPMGSLVEMAPIGAEVKA